MCVCDSISQVWWIEDYNLGFWEGSLVASEFKTLLM